MPRPTTSGERRPWLWRVKSPSARRPNPTRRRRRGVGLGDTGSLVSLATQHTARKLSPCVVARLYAPVYKLTSRWYRSYRSSPDCVAHSTRRT